MSFDKINIWSAKEKWREIWTRLVKLSTLELFLLLNQYYNKYGFLGHFKTDQRCIKVQCDKIMQYIDAKHLHWRHKTHYLQHCEPSSMICLHFSSDIQLKLYTHVSVDKISRNHIHYNFGSIMKKVLILIISLIWFTFPFISPLQTKCWSCQMTSNHTILSCYNVISIVYNACIKCPALSTPSN